MGGATEFKGADERGWELRELTPSLSYLVVPTKVVAKGDESADEMQAAARAALRPSIIATLNVYNRGAAINYQRLAPNPLRDIHVVKAFVAMKIVM